MIATFIFLIMFQPITEPIYYHEAVEPEKITVNTQIIDRHIK